MDEAKTTALRSAEQFKTEAMQATQKITQDRRIPFIHVYPFIAMFSDPGGK